LGGFWGRDARERDFHAELDAHFQMHIDDNLRAGMSPAEARRQAVLRFGSVDAATEEVRSRWTVSWLEHTRQDLVYALRMLRRNPGFAATAVLSLALGIGASVSIFTVADGVLLRPLPFRDPGRLVMVWETNPHRKGGIFNVISPGNYRDWKAQSTSFEGMDVFGDGRAILTDGQRAEELGIQYMSAGLLPMLNVQPWRGRVFTAAEDLPNTPDVVMLSYGLWQKWFAGDEGILGRKIQVAGRPATVVGVMPPGFYFRNREVDLWEPVRLDPVRDYRATSGRYLNCVARLKPGVSQARAQAEMSGIAQRLEQAYPMFDKNWGVNLEPVRDSMVREVKRSLLVLLGAVFLVLAVACANVANLLLARHSSRHREMAVRAAIGAGRGRLARQLLTESLVLGGAGGLLGLVLARWAVRGLLALAPVDLARNAFVAVDLRIVAFALGLSMLTGIAFGLIPSMIASRRDVLTGLREDGRGAIGGHTFIRKWLVAGEVAFSVMLLAGAGLMFRSLVGLQAVDPGLKADHLLTFRVSLPGARYPEAPKRMQFFARALDELRRLPGVQSASAINTLPFFGMPSGTSLHIEGRPPEKPGERLVTLVRTVIPGYFHTMGIPIRSGRDFSDVDNTPQTPYRFVVSESFARKYLAGERVLGARISVNMQDTNPYGEIVGVVADVKEGSVDQEPSPTVYYIHSHMTNGSMVFVVRTEGDPRTIAASARRIIHDLDAAQPVADVATMENVVRETFARQKFSAVLLAGFSVVSLLLAAVGIYGVLAYSVTERTREFGVRVALGAEPAHILSMVLSGGARVILAGTAAGIAGALALTGMLRTLLFGVTARDLTTFVTVPIVLMLVGMLAAWLPARRASRLAPIEALRAD
jgi:putative ABC transport system permease protein